jgi:hypothetical protein
MNDLSFQTKSIFDEHNRINKLRSVFERRGFYPTSKHETIDNALMLGANALGGELVGVDTVIACERKTRRCFFAQMSEDGNVSGFIALLYLNRDGYQALMFGDFNPSEPDLSHLAAPHERAMAIYVWCLAGIDDAAKRAVVRAVTEARRRAFPDIALFARPVSREGRMMTAALDAPGAGTAWLGWVPAQQVETVEG